MNEKLQLCRNIDELDFAVHEIELFLDTHPDSMKAIGLLRKFRQAYAQAIAAYEEKFGSYVLTARNTQPDNHWNWLDGPWPWEKEFSEA